MALKHPFITREKYHNKFIPYKQDVTILHTSIDASLISEKNKSFHSLIVDYDGYKDLNHSYGSFHNNQFFQPQICQEIDLNKLNAKILRNPVPQATLANFYNNKPIKSKNKYDNPGGNNSFMISSFDSFNADLNPNLNFFRKTSSKKSNFKKKSTKQKNKFDLPSNTNQNLLTPYTMKKISDNGNFNFI